MNEVIIRDYNELIKYVGEKCTYKDKNGKTQTFRNLDYKGYIGISKNKNKKTLFDNKLKELLKSDNTFKVMVRKFNGKYSGNLGRITNSKNFLKIGANLGNSVENNKQNMKENKLDTGSATIKPNIETPKNKISFIRRVKGIWDTMPEMTKTANAVSSALFVGLVAIGGATSLITIAGIIPVSTIAYYGGKRLYKLYKNNKNEVNKKKPIVNNNSTKDDEELVNNMQPFPSFTETKEENHKIEQSILPQDVSSVAKFSKPKKFRVKDSNVEDNFINKTDDIKLETDTVQSEEKYTDKLNNLLGNDEEKILLTNNSYLDDRRERVQEKLLNNEIKSEETIELPSISKEKDLAKTENDNGFDNQEVKVGKHIKKEKSYEFEKQNVRSEIEKYLKGYGLTVEEFSKKYLKLLDSVKTDQELRDLNNNFKNELNQVLNSEIEYQNWRNNMTGDSRKKEAKEIKNDSKNMVEKYQNELNLINKDKLQSQRDYLESVRDNNLENNYIKSLCEIVIGKIDEYNKEKQQLDNMNSSDSNYAIKKAEVEKMYNNVYMYAFSVDDVIRKAVPTEETSRRK